MTFDTGADSTMTGSEKYPGEARRWLRTAVLVVGAILAVVLVLAGLLWWFVSYQFDAIVFGGTTEPIPQPSCEIAVSYDLGPSVVETGPALFSTNGSPIFVTITEFASSGFALPLTRGLVYIGEESVRPTYDNNSGAVTGALFEGTAFLDGFTEFDLPAGRYWLWTSQGRTSVASCDPDGVFDAIPRV